MNSRLKQAYNAEVTAWYLLKDNVEIRKVESVNEVVVKMEAEIEEMDNVMPELSIERHQGLERFNLGQGEFAKENKDLSDKLLSLAKKTSNGILLVDIKKCRELIRANNKESLINAAKILAANAALHEEPLAKILYTKADLTNFNNLREEFITLVDERKEHKLRAHRVSVLNKDYEQQTRVTLSELDSVMLGVKREFTKEYEQVMEILSGRYLPRTNKCSVKGSITDTNDEPLLGARVEIYEDATGEIAEQLRQGVAVKSLKYKPYLTKFTSVNGIFLIRTMPDGSYTTLVTMNGYEPVVGKLYINPKNSVAYSEKLKGLD